MRAPCAGWEKLDAQALLQHKDPSAHCQTRATRTHSVCFSLAAVAWSPTSRRRSRFRAGHCCSRSYSGVLGAARCYVSTCNGAVPCPPPTREHDARKCAWEGGFYLFGQTLSGVPESTQSSLLVSRPRTWHGVPCRRGLLRVCEGVLDGGADAALRCRPYVVSHLAGSPVAFTPIRSIASHQSHTSPCAPRTPAPPLHRAAGGTVSSSAWAPCSPTLSTSHPRSRRCT